MPLINNYVISNGLLLSFYALMYRWRTRHPKCIDTGNSGLRWMLYLYVNPMLIENVESALIIFMLHSLDFIHHEYTRHSSINHRPYLYIRLIIVMCMITFSLYEWNVTNLITYGYQIFVWCILFTAQYRSNLKQIDNVYAFLELFYRFLLLLFTDSFLSMSTILPYIAFSTLMLIDCAI
jgi:hypothetical protein